MTISMLEPFVFLNTWVGHWRDQSVYACLNDSHNISEFNSCHLCSASKYYYTPLGCQKKLERLAWAMLVCATKLSSNAACTKSSRNLASKLRRKDVREPKEMAEGFPFSYLFYSIQGEVNGHLQWSTE